MPILIDGYNLLHAIKGDFGGDLVQARNGTCSLLADAARYSQQFITVIFDGTPPRGVTLPIDTDQAHMLHVEYSGGGISADSRIQKLIDKSSAPRLLWVVSDDREIIRHARRRRCRCWKTLEFWLWVQQHAEGPPPPTEPPEKRRGGNSADTDYWLDQMGIELDENEEEHP